MVEMNDHLVCAVETRGNNFTDDVHEVFGFLYDVINFAEGGCSSHRRLFYCEL